MGCATSLLELSESTVQCPPASARPVFPESAGASVSFAWGPRRPEDLSDVHHPRESDRLVHIGPGQCNSPAISQIGTLELGRVCEWLCTFCSVMFRCCPKCAIPSAVLLSIRR